jgi:hypothetical protein
MEPNVETVMDCARRVFKANVRNYEDWTYEWGVALYWTLQGRVVEGKPTMGEEQEVVVPDEPHLGIPVACIHSHLDNCELTDFDREQGQQEANKNGRFFIQCVMGWSNEQDGVAMSQEVFEPEIQEALAAAAQESRSHDVVKALLDNPDEDQWREISRGQAQHIQEAFEAKGNKLTGTVSIGSADFRQRDGNWQRRLRGEQQRQESEEPPGRLIALAIRKAKKSSKYWSHE